MINRHEALWRCEASLFRLNIKIRKLTRLKLHIYQVDHQTFPEFLLRQYIIVLTEFRNLSAVIGHCFKRVLCDIVDIERMTPTYPPNINTM